MTFSSIRVNSIFSRLRGSTVSGKIVVRFGSSLAFVNKESKVVLKDPHLCLSERLPPYCLLQDK